MENLKAPGSLKISLNVNKAWLLNWTAPPGLEATLPAVRACIHVKITMQLQVALT